MKPTKKSDDGSILQQAKWNNENPSAEKKQINNWGSTHPSTAASEENKFPPSFLGFKSQKFLHESSYDGVSRTENDEQY